ncbi:GntR family transcriptional regulator [Aliishimia ponticola]|uniref:GntR family transcriptional regulator n=1 Tax=Aliishimia ponticola TaxID=2499833 RepID=A0A4S4NEV4_9RHOB|nr:GntR family transcriptional regulator [Aliishimia ponticola]THH36668.1 GntR family transcriptional regulator [Aliishimia ponticola]
MQGFSEVFERRTAADVVFDQLQQDVTTLKLLPGTRLSEAEVAKRFGVSRQPVRDAFARLANLDLLLIRPQKATEVRGFSMERIAHARFVRLAVELEVIQRACAIWDDAREKELSRILDTQYEAIAAKDITAFHASDYAFHKGICDLAGYPLAFETIQSCKHKVDRLCVLSLGRQDEVDTLLNDHARIADALSRGDVKDATDSVRLHLSRLDDTIADIHAKHVEYFE